VHPHAVAGISSSTREIRHMTTTEPKILVDGYNSQTTKTVPPRAAQFGKGARDLTEIKQATDARREHSAKLSDPGRQGWKPQSPNS
jgi:hypothetical protein